MAGSEFSIACEHYPDEQRCVVTLRGEIDIATVPAIREFVLALDVDVEVNCHDVSFIDSSGIGMFIVLDEHARGRGRKLGLRNVSGNCYRLFEMTGLTQHLDLHRAGDPT